MTLSWFGLVGPGVRHLGLDNERFSDHADLRPSMLALLGLSDDYRHDGRVLIEKFDTSALPQAVAANSKTFIELADLYKTINAPLGLAARNSLSAATRAMQSRDQTYAGFLAAMNAMTTKRNELAAEIKTHLDGAAFHNRPIETNRASSLLSAARALLARSFDLASSPLQ
jgi:hypothetical protein